MGGLGSGPRYGTDSLGQYKTPDKLESVQDGLWRPGGALRDVVITTSAHSCSNFGTEVTS